MKFKTPTDTWHQNLGGKIDPQTMELSLKKNITYHTDYMYKKEH